MRMTERDPSTELERFSGPSAPAPTGIALDEALRNHWLEIWYQPKIDLKRKCLAGAEALARIRHPQQGMLWPERFLPGTDEASLVQLTEHALLATLRDWTSFADAGFDLHLAINVPASALSKLPIAEIVARNHPNYDSWPGLILEVTEDQIVRDIALAQKFAAELKACGVTLAIDDFGAG
jgi:EAL domain-containing protein (putative c-di-GMP-specific phosphodiesterase class I)